VSLIALETLHGAPRAWQRWHEWPGRRACLQKDEWLTARHYLACPRKDEDLEKLSQLGHFLKGSSATLGLVKVRDGCEKIQRFGKNENEDGTEEPDSELCLKRIKQALKAVKADYEVVEKALRKYYEGDKDKSDDA